MAITVAITKKYENEETVVYYYGDDQVESGEFSVNKHNLEVLQLKSTELTIDRIMFMSAASKIVKIVKSGDELPEKTSYNS